MTELSRRAILKTAFAAGVIPLLGLATDDALAQTPSLQFELYKDSKGGFRWRLKAGNGKTIASSSESYKTKANCRDGIDLVKRGAAAATFEDKTGTS